jgi:hypothetical protein
MPTGRLAGTEGVEAIGTQYPGAGDILSGMVWLHRNGVDCNGCTCAVPSRNSLTFRELVGGGRRHKLGCDRWLGDRVSNLAWRV